jgi:hypothetical protein
VRALPTLSGSLAPTADSASGGFVRQIPPLPVTPAVGRLLNINIKEMVYEIILSLLCVHFFSNFSVWL